MRKSKKLFYSLLLIAILLFCNAFSAPIRSLAAESDNYDVIAARIQNELDKLNKAYAPNIYISINESLLTTDFVNQVVDMDDEQLHNYLKSIYISSMPPKTTVRLAPSPQLSMISPAGIKAARSGSWSEYKTVSKECSVSSAIPSIGICWINIPYTATMKKLSTTGEWYIDRVDVGWSYQTGVSAATWSQSSSSVQKGQYETYANITVTGVISYGLYGTPLQIQTQQSFIYTLRANEIMQ